MTESITLNEELAEQVKRLSKCTGLSSSAIVNRLLSSHLAELHELEEFLEAHPAGVGTLHEQALNLIQSYGPESIVEGISRIAPYYQTLAARFERDLADTIGDTPYRS
jgi:hypothetical protein